MTWIVVAGLGRCGSSLTMQMLHAGGIPCLGHPPAFEPPGTSSLNFQPGYVRDHPGHAFKLLDPHKMTLPFPQGEYLTIFLTRNIKRQALSQTRFLEQSTGLLASRLERNKVRHDLKEETQQALYACPKPVRSFTFEEICRSPIGYARQLTYFLASGGFAADPERMAACFRPRVAGAEVQPDLKIEMELAEEAENARRLQKVPMAAT